ncbi:MAG: homing endonuclease associated repeat-containing protein [Gaiellaceae bacterium]
MTGKSGSNPFQEIDPASLASFRAGLRRRYSDDEILTALRDCASRLGRSPTMRDLADDPKAGVHPQTVVGRFGSWNAAKRLAGLSARRFATREELLEQLRALGNELGRAPTGRDLANRRGSAPSKSLLWQTFGSLTNALREAGFDIPSADDRVERALAQGELLARRLGRLPRFADWAEARRQDPRMLTEWQVYRLFDRGRGAWSSFQYRLRERLVGLGAQVGPDGKVS